MQLRTCYIYFKTVVVLQGSTIETSMYLIDDNCTVRNLCVVCGEYRALVLSVTSIEMFVLSVMSIDSCVVCEEYRNLCVVCGEYRTRVVCDEYRILCCPWRV